MPYPANPQRRVPTTRAIVGAEFVHADGQVDAHGNYAELTGASPVADLDKQVVHRKVELSCGCYWPDAEVAGVCAECASAGGPSNVCKAHFVVCPCGTPCCWRHSAPLEGDPVRLCSRCQRRAKNKALAAALRQGVGDALRRLFGR